MQTDDKLPLLLDDPGLGDLPAPKIGDARGGRRPAKSALEWEVVRELEAGDLPLLNSRSAPALPAPRQTLSQVRHSHHLLAQLLASGTCADSEASLITGYAPAYISLLRGDPTFQELLAYYSSQTAQRFVDVVDRMRSLGLSTLDELQTRLESDPDDWTKRELMELAELMLVKPGASRGGGVVTGGAPAGGVQVNVQFVSAKPRPEGPVIDLEPEK